MMSLMDNPLPDRFQVLGELGRGGTSIVFRALDTQSEQEVAVKVLLKNSEEDRFRREAERLASISHPNVVSFLEVGHHNGHDFLVMEYLQMGDLTSYIQNHTVVDILRFFIQICDGLAHLHDRNIVHRDIKPANILVDGNGHPKITDLGVARQMERNTRLTQVGTILGTYSYLAPEQILSSTVGPRADIYSLGVCLFGALTGRKPFEADNEFKMLKAHLEEEPPSILEFLPEAPQCLDELINSMLAKEEDKRPRSARAVADLLGEAVRELQNRHQEDLQPAWEEKFEELPEDQRSVLLAITYLGKDATFARVCQATPFSEDKTDQCLEELLRNRLIDSPTDDSFVLTFPDETIQTRLTPRLRKLFAARLDKIADSRESASALRLEPEEPTVLKETPENLLPQPVEAPEEAAPEVPREIVVEQPELAELEKPVLVASTGFRWLWVSLATLFLGVGLAVGGQWYWAHSAGLTVTSQPAGATVQINGRKAGVTPLEVSRLQPGVQVVRIAFDGYKSSRRQVELGFAETGEVHVGLEPIVGKLLLTLKPRDALVTIDSQVYGEIQSDLKLAAGTHQLKVEKPGFQPYESKISIHEEVPLEVEVELQPIVAAVTINSKPGGAQVSLDGENVGKTPLTLEGVSFGQHEVGVRLGGYDRFLTTVEVNSDKPITLSPELVQLPGALSIDSIPSGAKLKINGEVKGKTPTTVNGLAAGEYTVSLSLDGYQAFQKKVVVKAGQESKPEFRLNAIPKPQPVYQPAPRPYNPPSTYQPPVSRPAPPPARPQPSGNPWIVE